MLNQQEREREEARQRKLAWVEKQGGGGGDTRKVEAPSTDDAAAHIRPTGPPQKIVVSIGTDATTGAAAASGGRGTGKAKAGKDAASWNELDPTGKEAAGVLGWTPASWNAGDACDASYRRWQQLNAGQRKAAVQLGYDPQSWNADAGLEDAEQADSGPKQVQGGAKGPKGGKAGGKRGGQHEAEQPVSVAGGSGRGGQERVVARAVHAGAGGRSSLVVQTTGTPAPGGGGSGAAKGGNPAPGAAAGGAGAVDEAALEARLEREGKLPPRYVRGRESVLLLKIETGPSKRAALVVRKGDDPSWLARGFCRRHNIPAQLTAVVQKNIEDNVAAASSGSKQ